MSELVELVIGCRVYIQQDARPKGVVKLIPGSWCQPIAQGTARRSDAMAQPNPGVISVVRDNFLLTVLFA